MPVADPDFPGGGQHVSSTLPLANSIEKGNTVRVFETFRHIIIKNTAQHTAAEPKAVFNVPSEKLLTVDSKIFIDGHDISASRNTDSRFLE